LTLYCFEEEYFAFDYQCKMSLGKYTVIHFIFLLQMNNAD